MLYHNEQQGDFYMSKQDKKMYIMVAIALCGLMGSSVGVGLNTAGLFFTPVSNSLGISRGSISFTYTIVSLVSALTAMVLPKILNTKTFKPILFVGSLMLIGGTALQAICSSAMTLYLFNFIRGVGLGLLHFVMVTFVLNNWFKAKYSVIASVVLSFSGIPGALLSGTITNVIVSSGWRTGYLFVAGIMLIFNLPALLLPITLYPKDCGMKAYGESTIQLKQEAKEDNEEFQYTLPSYMLLLVFAILAASLPSVSSHIPSYAESIHYSASVGALTLSCCMAMNIFSKILFGILSDKIGTKYTVFVMCGMNFISAVLLLNASSTLILLAGSFLYGTIYGATTTGNVLITKELYKDGYDKAFPLINFLGAVFGAIATVLFGVIYDQTGSYHMMFVLVLVFQVINIISIHFAYIARKKERANAHRNKGI